MPAMPNIASILKVEISRVARKEIRTDTQGLKKAVVSYRSEIAALKRRTLALERMLKKEMLASARTRRPSVPDAGVSKVSGRFSAKGFLSLRKKIGVSAEQMGRLIGASGQSVYNWESGTARPREKHLISIGTLRGVGKREIARRLGTIDA